MLNYRRKLLFTLCIAMMILMLPFTAFADTTPGKVESVTATVTAKKVSLSWSSVAGARGYDVYLQDAKTEETFHARVKKRTSTTITGLLPGTTFNAWVEAYNRAGEGEASDSITCTTLAKTSGKSVKDVHTMYFSAYLNKEEQGLPQGTKVVVTDKSYIRAENSEVVLPNGNIRFIPEMSLTYTGCLNERGDYTTQVKEDFINRKGVGSATEYLVWVCTNYQKFYVFRGSSGNWTLFRTYKCTTGSYESPTRPSFGYRIKNKIDSVSFDEYSYGKYGLYFGQFIHTWPYYKGSETSKVAGYRTLGSLPQSHGCVRLTDEAALWCYENLPMDTRVVVF